MDVRSAALCGQAGAVALPAATTALAAESVAGCVLGGPATAEDSVEKGPTGVAMEVDESVQTAVAAAAADAAHAPAADPAASVLYLTASMPPPPARVYVSPVLHRDPQKAPEYSADIYTYWRKLELVHVPRPHPGRSFDISANMRAILVDWLVEVADECARAACALRACGA